MIIHKILSAWGDQCGFSGYNGEKDSLSLKLEKSTTVVCYRIVFQFPWLTCVGCILCGIWGSIFVSKSQGWGAKDKAFQRAGI